MSRKKVLVLGATGATGQHVVSRALEEGHDVTLLVREPARLPAPFRGLRLHVGSSTDADALGRAVAGQDAVISTLGVGKSFKPQGLIAASVPALVQAMTSHQVRRVIVTSAYGVGPTMQYVPFVPKLFMRTLLRHVYADKAAGDSVLRNTVLDWTLGHPVTLTNSEATGKYRVGERLALRGFPVVSRADVAHFLVKQIDDRSFVRTSVLVSN
jgi:uncharacterized protein YbjT (DUF2867 family)